MIIQRFEPFGNRYGTGLGVPAAALTLGGRSDRIAHPVATFDVSLSGGLKAFAVAAGSIGGNGESFRLLVVDATNFPWGVAEVLSNVE